MEFGMKDKWFDLVGGFFVRLSPGSVAVLGSLLLSLIAFISDPVLNRDGMLYIHTAELLMNGEFEAAREKFNWLFFPMLISGAAWVTSIDPEIVAYLLCAAFLAGTCFYLVRISDRLMPGTAWVAVVVALCLPALNDYRPYVVRDFGAWFFVLGSLYAVVCWRESRDWRNGVLFQAGTGVAMLFRPEMAFVFPGVLLAWPWLRRPERDFRDLGTLFWICGVAAVVVAGFLVRDLSLVGGRLEKFLGYLNLSEQLGDFRNLAQHFGAEILNRFSRESAGFILFSGLVAMIPAKALGLLGVLAAPLGYAFRPGLISQGRFRAVQPFPTLGLVYLGILVLFLVVKQFLSDRYVILLVLLLTPLVVEGFRAWSALPWARGWRYFFMVLLFVTAGDGVITTGDRKLYFKSAGEWIRQHPLPQPVYFDEPRQRYYAGFAYEDKDESPSRDEVLTERGGDYRSLVLLVENQNQAERLQQWTEQNRFRQIASFGEKHQGVRILVSGQR